MVSAGNEHTTYESVKVVWSYWQGKQPAIVKLSMDSWHKHLGNWTINVLNRTALQRLAVQLPKKFDALTPTMQSDVIRLSILHRYGGLWMDASVVLQGGLEWLSAYSSQPFFAFMLHR